MNRCRRAGSTPGIGIKRWLLRGVRRPAAACRSRVAHFLRQVTRDLAPGGLAEALVDVVTLQFLPFALRGFVAASVGIALVAIGAYAGVAGR